MKKKQLYTALIAFFFYQSIFAQILNPLSITGLKGWYSSDSINLSAGMPISNWKDLSGNDNHLVQSTPANQGSLQANQLHNKPSVNFNGINTFYRFTDSVDFRTVIIVNKVNDTIFKSDRGLLGGDQNSFGVGGYLINGVKNFTYIVQGNNSSIFSKILKNNTSVFPIGDFSPMYISWIGQFEFNTNRKQPADLGRIAAGLFADRYWNGDIFELIIFNKVLSATESNDIFNYLNDKYAPPVNVGADITINNSFCDTTLSTTRPFKSYLWSTGAVTPTISVNKSGKYWVRATNIFGKSSSDTIQVDYPEYNFPTKHLICTSDEFKWDSELPKSDFDFLWQDNATTDSLYTISQSGNFYIKLTDNFGCYITTDTLKVTEDAFPVTATLGPDKPICSGNFIYLTNGAVPGLSYIWNDLSTNDSLLVTNAGQYSVIVTNTNNCVAKDTIIISISGQVPVANFSSLLACKNSSVSFSDLSTAPTGNTIDKWDWNFGNTSTLADTSHLQNPFYTYTDTGLTNVTLSVYTDAGCKQSVTKAIHVYPKPAVNFSNIIACKNDSALFTSTINTYNYPISNYNWTFGDPVSGIYNTSSLSNPKHLFSQQAGYTVTLNATNSVGCSDVAIKTVFVRAEVTADFSYSAPCTNAAIVFQDQSITPGSSGSDVRNWSITTSHNLIITKQYTLSGTYTVNLTVNSSNGCVSSITKQIDVMNPPLVSFNSSNFCSKDTITLTDLSSAQNGSISAWNWKLNNAYFSSVTNPTLSVTSAANHTIQLTATNSFGCRDSVKNMITVFPLPVVNFSTNPAQYIYTNIPVTLVPNISNGNYYNWDIPSIGNYSTQSPTVSFSNTGIYSVTLALKDNNNCKGYKNSVVNVLNRYLDLGIVEIRSSKNASNYMSVEVDLANFGSIPVTTFDISYSINNSGSVIETWSGSLNPGNFFTYQFNSKTLVNSTKEDEITCVAIQAVNTTPDQNINNNNLCRALNTDNTLILDPYPNPSDGNITLPVILNRDEEYTLQIFNTLGQIVMDDRREKGIMGLNLITIQTDNYERGCYFLKVTINDKIYLKKFLKNSGY